LTAADRLLKTLQADTNLKSILGDSLTETTDLIKDKEAVSEKYSFSLGEKGLKPIMDFLDLTKLTDNDPLLSIIFNNDNHSGLEEFFRGNPFITYRFLRAHGLLIELGRLFIVLEKAIQCAKQGGTLLVYGVTNNLLTMLLDSTKSLITAIRDEFTCLNKIAECAFEKIIYETSNNRSGKKWIKHYKMVFPCSTNINDAIKQVYEDISGIKLCANTITIYEKFQKAEKESNEFLESAMGFSERTARVLGLPYNRPQINDEELNRNAIDNTAYYLGKMQATQFAKEK
jgi:hypothetical protein